ncbi:hypothetical protein NBT05_05055 [Aquimarina sp. ERC-38]|uniref:hypothetical protein n=1 Tax=Aquimarina sp. ERC-38 TaxID=2949996 RepID=UPI00224660AD|nr:hypothetical protein [Aquimarina sp. ERC-38]UZO81834.1 hypothetical protein NBT05_05055 [Aquimarina sp. ERC-38]
MRIILLLLLLAYHSTYAQNKEDLKALAQSQAQQVLDATIDQDAPTLLRFTHPKILKKYGKKELKGLITDVFKAMEEGHIRIEKSEVTEVSELVKEQGEYRCLVKNQIRMSASNQIVAIKSAMIGFYDDGNQQWNFIESSKLTKDPETQNLFSDFKTSLEIPEDEQVIEE